jgi:hypothetical protein
LDLRGRKWQEARDDCMKGFITCMFLQILGSLSQEGRDGQAMYMHGRDEKFIQGKARGIPWIRWENNIKCVVWK